MAPQRLFSHRLTFPIAAEKPSRYFAPISVYRARTYYSGPTSIQRKYVDCNTEEYYPAVYCPTVVMATIPSPETPALPVSTQ